MNITDMSVDLNKLRVDLNKLRIDIENGELVLSRFDKISLAKLIETAAGLLINPGTEKVDIHKGKLILEGDDGRREFNLG